MRVGLIAVDSKHPNLALMKISSHHKGQGDQVEWHEENKHYDVVYLSKISTSRPTSTSRLMRTGL